MKENTMFFELDVHKNSIKIATEAVEGQEHPWGQTLVITSLGLDFGNSVLTSFSDRLLVRACQYGIPVPDRNPCQSISDIFPDFQRLLQQQGGPDYGQDQSWTER
jgi:hypothetical protein